MGVLEGRGGGGKGGSKPARRPQEEPDTLRSSATVRLIDVVSEGPIRGLVDGLGSIYFDDTPLQGASGGQGGVPNFRGVEVHERIGLPDQDTLLGFPMIETLVPVGIEVILHEPLVRQISDPNVTMVLVTVRIPALWHLRDNGDLVASTINVLIDLKGDDGPWINQVEDRIEGKTTSPYEKSYRIWVDDWLYPRLPPWSIRVRRNQATDGAGFANQTWWSSYTEVVHRKMRYPDTAHFAVLAEARQFGDRVPVRSYEIDGVLMKVPGNYDPFTRTYSGSWNGTFKTEWTNNPAWVFYLLATHQRFGLGQWLDESLLDKWALYEIARYCDELVPDGFGGTEPRFTFNGVLHTRDDALKVLQLIAASFQGMAFWNGSMITATQDRPTDPAVLVTPANVIDGQFEYSGVGYKARHSVAMVTWNDPKDSYRGAIEVVEDPDLVERFGWRPAEIVAFGCTSRGQAHRMGKWLLDSEKHASQVVTYRASFDHMVGDGSAVLPGDVVLVQDPAYAGVRFGGRLTSVAANIVGLDAPVTLLGNESYVFHVVLPDGTLAERAITNGPGSHSTVSFANLPQVPLVGAMWVITASNVAPRQFRVIGVAEIERNVVEVTALLHDPTKYDRIEQGVILELPADSLLPGGSLPAPVDMSFAEYMHRVVGQPRAAVSVSWTATTSDARVAFYELQVRRPGQSWSAAGESTAPQLDVPDIEPGIYDFRVRSLGSIGGQSSWLQSTGVALIGLDSRPGDVEGFTVQSLGDTAHLSWLPDTAANLSHYRIKFQASLSGASWGSAVDLVGRVSRDVTGIALASMIGTYLIKAVSVTGRESQNAALIITNIKKVHGLNVVEELLEHPGFAGDKTDTVAADGALRLASTAGVFVEGGSYAFAQVADLGHAFTCRVLAELQVASFKPDTAMATWQPLAIADPLSGADASVWSATLQISTAMQGTGDDPEWSAWKNLVVGDYTARSYRFRLLLATSDTSVTPFVTLLRVEIDLPDRSTGRANVPCPVIGTTVTFAPPFMAPPAVAITLHGAAEGDQVVLTNQTAMGFEIQVLNGGAGVERSFNWVAQGFGYEDG